MSYNECISTPPRTSTNCCPKTGKNKIQTWVSRWLTLHPQGQAKLGELLAKAANDGVQVIIESHSDHLFNGIRVAIKQKIVKRDDVSVFYFERDENSAEHITTISQPVIESDGRISHRPKGFFDEYSKQLDQIIK